LVADLPLAASWVAGFLVACVRRFEERFFATGRLVAVLPDDTRDECFARGRTFPGAASAAAPRAHTATSSAAAIVIVLRIIESSSAG
jgi:hypothetical protein